MTDEHSTISVNQMHRMLPSDLDRLKAVVSSDAGAYSTLGTFVKYLRSIGASGVELDDVARITLQLNAVGLWDVIRPEFFIRHFHNCFAKEVVNELSRVLHLDLTKAKSDGVIRTEDRPTLMAALQEKLGVEPVYGLVSVVESKKGSASSTKGRMLRTPNYVIISARGVPGKQSSKVVKDAFKSFGKITYLDRDKGFIRIKPSDGSPVIVISMRTGRRVTTGLKALKKGQTVEVRHEGQIEAQNIKLK